MNLSATYRRPVGRRRGLARSSRRWASPRSGPSPSCTAPPRARTRPRPSRHHWLDSTHITNNVITAGWGRGRVALEASAFHGREPDEHRWNLDGGTPDSVSGRLKLLARPRMVGAGLARVRQGRGGARCPATCAARRRRSTTATKATGRWPSRWCGDGTTRTTAPRTRLLAEAAWQATAPRSRVRAGASAWKRTASCWRTSTCTPRTRGRRRRHRPRARADRRLRAQPRLGGSLNLGLGADLTVYGVPRALREAYGAHPVSTHVFARLRWGRPHGAHAHGGH